MRCVVTPVRYDKRSIQGNPARYVAMVNFENFKNRHLLDHKKALPILPPVRNSSFGGGYWTHMYENPEDECKYSS